jgi:hypothetical protein
VHVHLSFSIDKLLLMKKYPPSHYMRGRLGARGVGFHFIFVCSAFVAFVFIRSALVAFVFVCSAFVVSIAPVTHPVSSGSQTWWQVLWWGVCHFVRFIQFCTFGSCCVCSTCYPPCEQWLTGMVAGAGGGCWVGIRYMAFICVSSPPLTIT